MTCAQARPLFSPYLDGAVTGKPMRELSQHIEACERCSRQYVSLRQTQHLLARVGPRKAPADLALKLRVTVSQQAAQSRRRYFEGIRVRFDNALNLLMLHTAPQLQQSAFGSTLDSINDDSLVIEAYVDSQGRVQDYRILSDSEEDATLLPQVKKNMLIFTTFTTFRPALSMGRPTTGRAILSFSKVSVKG